MIAIESKRRKRENILKKYHDSVIADVTSQATDGLVRLSPFYPHGGIPVPFSEGYTAMCVEAIWQGLKVFESADVDVNMFANDTMKNIKRTVRRFGKPLGHRKGVNGTELLGYKYVKEFHFGIIFLAQKSVFSMIVRLFATSVLAKPLNNAQIVRGVFCLYTFEYGEPYWLTP